MQLVLQNLLNAMGVENFRVHLEASACINIHIAYISFCPAPSFREMFIRMHI